MVSTFRAGLLAAALSLTGAGAHAQGEQTLKIRLDWKPGGQHAPFYLGKARGYYKQEGVNLEIISGSGSSDTIKQVATGAVELGLLDALVLVQGAEQRVPVKSIAAYYQRNPIVIISPKAKPITEPKQLLTGLKVGSAKGSATYQGLIALLSANNMTLEQIRVVDIGFGVQPLLVGQVDAIMGFSAGLPQVIENSGMPVHLLAIADHGVDSYGLTIISNARVMKEKAAALRGFLKATTRAMTEATANPAAAVAEVTKIVDELNASLETKILTSAAALWQSPETRERGLGWQTPTRWQGSIDVARKLKVIESALRPESVFDNAFLATAR